MFRDDFMFTSESVTEGHPDKLCDQISDALVDRYLEHDPLASIIAECAISTGIVFVAARVAAEATIDIPTTVRDVIRGAGYHQAGFDVHNCTVMTSITHQPLSERLPELPRVSGPRTGGGDRDRDLDRILVRDQAVAFGYACNHGPDFMPLPIRLSHRLARRLSEVRKEGVLPCLAADAKTQVGVEFHHREPRRIHSLSLVASQWEPEQPPLDELREMLLELVVKPVFADEPVRPDHRTRTFINPSGPVIRGGPAVHSGMTGRKTAVDTYGEFCRCSASALSGKDPTRIDRVGAYAARYAAKNVVAAGLARECEVQLSYCIGLPGPVSVQLDTFGTGRYADEQLAERVQREFDFRLAGIMQEFELREQPAQCRRFYQQLGVFGQVGRADLELPWEQINRCDSLCEGLPKA